MKKQKLEERLKDQCIRYIDFYFPAGTFTETPGFPDYWLKQNWNDDIRFIYKQSLRDLKESGENVRFLESFKIECLIMIRECLKNKIKIDCSSGNAEQHI